MSRRQTRHAAQAGTTLVELLVSITIIGLSLALIVGTFSTGLIDSALSKRNVAVEAVTQYELAKIRSASFTSTQSYSDCFAIVNTASPLAASGYQGTCPAGFDLRADVSYQPYSATVQDWTIVVNTMPAAARVGSPLSVYKADHQ